MQGFLRAAGLGLAALSVEAAAFAQEAAAETEKEGVSLAFWIAIAVPIVLGVLFAIRAATSGKKF